jgi:hypothetical protein
VSLLGSCNFSLQDHLHNRKSRIVTDSFANDSIVASALGFFCLVGILPHLCSLLCTLANLLFAVGERAALGVAVVAVGERRHGTRLSIAKNNAGNAW